MINVIYRTCSSKRAENSEYAFESLTWQFFIDTIRIVLFHIIEIIMAVC